MTPHALANAAYKTTNEAILDPRRAEFAAFSRVTGMLASVCNAEKNGIGQLAAVLHENRRLWITLAALVADDDNALPEQLRARIFYLSQFVEQHSRKVLFNDADPSVLVEINRAIMQGLNRKEAQT